jgi:hypothetical protein
MKSHEGTRKAQAFIYLRGPLWPFVDHDAYAIGVLFSIEHLVNTHGELGQQRGGCLCAARENAMLGVL